VAAHPVPEVPPGFVPVEAEKPAKSAKAESAPDDGEGDSE